MIQMIIQNSAHSQIYLLDTQSKLLMDELCEDEMSIVTLLLFDKNSSSFMPILFTLANGPLVAETVQAVRGFMRAEFPNVFKPAKFIVDNHSQIVRLFESNQVSFNLFHHSQIVWQTILDSFICSVSELMHEDVLLLAMFSKAIIMWTDDQNLDRLESIYQDFKIDQKCLRRFLQNFENAFSKDHVCISDTSFLDSKCLELFREIEIAKEYLSSFFAENLPKARHHSFCDALKTIMKIEKEHRKIYDNALEPIAFYERTLPI